MGKIDRLTPEEHAEVTAAVSEAEKTTDGEIVTIVSGRSDNYNDVGLHWAIAASFLGLSAVAMFTAWFMEWLQVLLGGGWERELPAGLTLTFLVGWMILLFLAVRYLLAIMPPRMALTPKRTQARRVRRRALVYFQVGAERQTLGRPGILLYLSTDDHLADTVADAQIAPKISP